MTRRTYFEQKQVNIPVFIAAVQVIIATLLCLGVSIVYRWPYNALPLMYLMMSLGAYGLTFWAARDGGMR